MKTFGELTIPQRNLVISRAKRLLVAHILEGIIIVDMPNKITQYDFDRILLDARRDNNLSLAGDMLVNHVAIDKYLTGLAIAAAQGSHYNEDNSFLTIEQ